MIVFKRYFNSFLKIEIFQNPLGCFSLVGITTLKKLNSVC